MSKRRCLAAAFLLIFVLAMGATLAPAADDPAATNPDWHVNGAYLRKAVSDVGAVGTAPVRWDGSDLLKFAAFAGATGLIFVFDRDIYDWVQDHKTAASIDASKVISKFGNGAYLAGFLAVLYGSGEIFDSRPLRKTALVGVESFLAASAVITVIKIVAGRARPYSGEGPYSFHPFSFKGKYVSLASADAATAFAVATTIDEQSDSFWIDALAYTAAGLAAVYRVHDQKHWPSDVFAGSVIGIFMARAINALNKDGSGVQVSFQAGGDRSAVTLLFAF